MKSYQYNGFKFVETSVAFSGGAFGKGISTMRTFKIKKKYEIIGVNSLNCCFNSYLSQYVSLLSALFLNSLNSRCKYCNV